MRQNEHNMTRTYDISKPMILWYGKNKVATSAANGPTRSHFNRKRQAAYLILFKMYSRVMNEFFQREQLGTATLKCMYIFYTTKQSLESNPSLLSTCTFLKESLVTILTASSRHSCIIKIL